MNRTDLAYELLNEKKYSEGLISREYLSDNIKINHVSIDKKAEKLIKKLSGDYYTIFCPKIAPEAEENALIEVLLKILPKGTALVAGFGNENITTDCLGVRAAKSVAATSHLAETEDFRLLSLNKVFAINTGVMAQTGMESSEQLRFLCEGIKPDFVIAIDSLACAEYSRLCSTIQITNAGISLGAGVNNNRKSVSKEEIGVPVIAVGVPTVIDVIKDEKKFMATTNDIDVSVRYFAKIISSAINRALNPIFTKSDFENLMF